MSSKDIYLDAISILNAVNGDFATSGVIVRDFLSKNVRLHQRSVDLILQAYVQEFRDNAPLLIQMKSWRNQLSGDNYGHAGQFYEKYRDLVDASEFRDPFLNKYSSARRLVQIDALSDAAHANNMESCLQEDTELDERRQKMARYNFAEETDATFISLADLIRSQNVVVITGAGVSMQLGSAKSRKILTWTSFLAELTKIITGICGKKLCSKFPILRPIECVRRTLHAESRST